MVFRLFLKVFFLYGISFLFSVSLYFYLNRKLLPPHRTLEFPLIWREDGKAAVVELEKGQRIGGNFHLKGADKFEPENLPVIQSNVPYDISLLLKYPDRPEISDLGNLKFSLKLLRRDGKEAGKIENFRSLRYESKILRFAREILNLPISLWKDSGSERIERISLVQKLIDETEKKEKGKEKEKENEFIFNTKKVKNPIDKLEISIDPLPSIHSIHLEVLVNLSPLQHFLFYWRVPAAILIIGGFTSIFWFIISFYTLIEIVKLVLSFRKQKETVDFSSEIEPITEDDIDNEIDTAEAVVYSDIEDQNFQNLSNDQIVSVQFPQAESVEKFIGELRQRKLKPKDEDDEAISIYNSETEDQSVPTNSSNNKIDDNDEDDSTEVISEKEE